MKVLRILEGDMIMDGNYASSPGSEADQYSSGQLRNDGWDMFSETARLANTGEGKRSEAGTKP